MQQNMMGPNIIITESSSNLRALGRNALAGKWKVAVIALVIYELCIGIPPVILNELFGVNVADVYYNYGSTQVYYDYSYVYESMPSYSILSSIYIILVTGAFTLGITLFFLALFRRQNVGAGDIFLGFEQFVRAMGLLLFQTLFIFLWSLLLIIPGIIAAIRYSQAFFIFADDPEKSIRQCMNESKQMMKGNCWKYFCLDLSFIGWILLSALPPVILEQLAATLNAPVFIQALISVFAYLCLVPVTAYRFSAFTGFYEILAGHLIKETEPAPIYPEVIAAAAAIPEEVPERREDVGSEESTAEESSDNLRAEGNTPAEALAETADEKSKAEEADAAEHFNVAAVMENDDSRNQEKKD